MNSNILTDKPKRSKNSKRGCEKKILTQYAKMSYMSYSITPYI